MADILIRGMEMPKTCVQCDLKRYDQERIWTDNGIELLGAWVCKRTDEIIWNTQRGENCPLDPLPEGHGRLIDGDVLLEQIRDGFDAAEKWVDAVKNDTEIKPRAEATVVAFWECGAKVKTAPTIVPAEGGADE